MPQQKQAIPKLRFPEFSGQWKNKIFGKVFSFHNTNSLSRADLNYKNGTVKNIHYGDIHTKFASNFDITKESVPFINSEAEPKISLDSYCKEGDIVIADASEDYKDIGKTIEVINLDGQKLVAGLHTYIARPIEDMAIGFSGYLMQVYNVRLQMMRIANGISVLGISKSNIATINLSLPTKAEQEKIAAFLTAVDERIAKLQEKKNLLTQYKSGAMQQIFSQKIRFRDDDGNLYPDWEVVSLADVFERITKKNIENEQNVLTISAQQGLISQLEYFNKSVSAKDVTGYYLLEKGDFAYNKSYSKDYPMGAIKRLTRYKCGVVSTLYICFRTKGGNLAEYFEHYFESRLINRELEKIAQEGARNHGLLNISVIEFFRDINILMPCKDEQKKIANFFSALDAKIDAVATQITHAQSFKKGLLQQMFV